MSRILTNKWFKLGCVLFVYLLWTLWIGSWWFDLRYYCGYIDSYVFLRGVHDPDFLYGEVHAGRGLSFREQSGLRTEIT